MWIEIGTGRLFARYHHRQNRLDLGILIYLIAH